MLNNPDTALSTSQNRWIISILTFHFKLHHIPGKQHGPNRLLCWPPQLGDISDNIDNPKEFNDWVNNLYSFTHLLNPSNLNSKLDQLLCAFTMEQANQAPADTENSAWEDPSLDYQTVPRTVTAIAANRRLEMAHDWLNTLEHPQDTSDHEYSLVIRYVSGFFTNKGVLWKCGPQGAHKWVLYNNQRTEALIVVHNNLGH
jgi:hypothetical protein